MCYYLYLFSDEEYQELEYDRENPGLFIVNVTRDGDRGANRWKTEKFTYYIGGYQGCGCGWQFSEFDDENERLNKLADRSSLKHFLSQSQSASFRFIAGYEGSQGDQISAKHRMSIDEFISYDFQGEDPIEYYITSDVTTSE